MRVMRWRNGALSGSDLANEPGLGSSRTYQPGEMPLPSKPKSGLKRMHQEMNSESALSSSPQINCATKEGESRTGGSNEPNHARSIWDSGELLTMVLPDSSRPITVVIVGVMMAIRWLEAHVKENNRQEAPTIFQIFLRQGARF